MKERKKTPNNTKKVFVSRYVPFLCSILGLFYIFHSISVEIIHRSCPDFLHKSMFCLLFQGGREWLCDGVVSLPLFKGFYFRFPDAFFLFDLL